MNQRPGNNERVVWTSGMLLACATVAGVLARVWVVHYGPGYDFAVDHLFDTLAWNLLSLHRFTLDGALPAAHVGPLYPAILALFYACFGHHQAWVPFLHVVFDLGTAWCIYRIGVTLFNSWTGAVAASLFLLYPAYWTYDPRIRSEALFTFLLSAWVLATVRSLRRPSFLQCALAGVVAGLTLLCKPVVMMLAILVAGLLWLGTHPGHRHVRYPILYLLACLVIVLPWTVRNYRAFGEIIPVSAGIGAGLWMGSDPISRGSWPMTAGLESAIWDSAGIAPLTYAHAMYDVPTDRFLREKGWARVGADPATYFMMVGTRAWDFWFGNAMYLANSEEGFAQGFQMDAAERGWLVAGYSLAKRLVLVPGLVLLAFLSAWCERARWRELLPLYVFSLGLMGGYIPFTVEAGRYALPVLPCLMLLSAAWVLPRIAKRSLFVRRSFSFSETSCHGV
jgi:4-amino-4-deoxy-L-arabinose transferase-like glycosyltransferase